MKIDHIGIAVEALAEAKALYAALGMPVSRQEEVPSEGVRIGFVDLGESHLELLEPLSEESPVAKFLAERGPGMHHLAVQVTDIEAAIERAVSAGLEMINEQPRQGAGGRLVAFVHPRGTGKVLVEFCQSSDEDGE